MASSSLPEVVMWVTTKSWSVSDQALTNTHIMNFSSSKQNSKLTELTSYPSFIFLTQQSNLTCLIMYDELTLHASLGHILHPTYTQTWMSAHHTRHACMGYGIYTCMMCSYDIFFMFVYLHLVFILYWRRMKFPWAQSPTNTVLCASTFLSYRVAKTRSTYKLRWLLYTCIQKWIWSKLSLANTKHGVVKNPIFFSWVSWLVEDSDSYPIWMIHSKKTNILEARLSQQFLFLQDDSMRSLNIVGYICHWVFVDVQGPFSSALCRTLWNCFLTSALSTFLQTSLWFSHGILPTDFHSWPIPKETSLFIYRCIFYWDLLTRKAAKCSHYWKQSGDTSNYLLSRIKVPDRFRGKSMHIIKRFNCFYF